MPTFILLTRISSDAVKQHLYAIERVRELFTKEEYEHLLRAWISFMGEKEIEKIVLDGQEMPSQADYDLFYETFSRLETKTFMPLLFAMVRSKQKDAEIKCFLIKGICDLYQGNYNPHFLTGLGSALWLIERHGWEHPIVVNELFQYVDYFFNGVRSGS